MELHLRRATLEDTRAVWEVNNSPYVRSQSRTCEPIPYEHHLNWFAKLLTDPQRVMYTVRNQTGDIIGVVRFDEVNQTDAEVSIALSDAWTGKGLGQIVIAQGCREYFELKPVTKVLAYIKLTNPGSQKAFFKAGFQTGADSASLESASGMMKLELFRQA